MEVLDNRIKWTDLVANVLSYLEIQIRGLGVQRSQEAVTSKGLNQEEPSWDSSPTADIVDSDGKIIFLNIFQRWSFAWGAEINVPCAWFSTPKPGASAGV